MRSMKLALPLLGLLALAQTAVAAEDPTVTKPIRTTINSIRYAKDGNAIAQFAGEAQGKAILGEEWARGTDAQRKEFITLFHTVVAKKAFPIFRENFQYLQPVLYEPAKLEGDKAVVGTTLVIMHPLKKDELKVKFHLVKSGAAWKILDVAPPVGDSLVKMAQEQINPTMKKSGWEGTLEAMRKMVASMK